MTSNSAASVDFFEPLRELDIFDHWRRAVRVAAAIGPISILVALLPMENRKDLSWKIAFYCQVFLMSIMGACFFPIFSGMVVCIFVRLMEWVYEHFTRTLADIIFVGFTLLCLSIGFHAFYMYSKT